MHAREETPQQAAARMGAPNPPHRTPADQAARTRADGHLYDMPAADRRHLHWPCGWIKWCSSDYAAPWIDEVAAELRAAGHHTKLVRRGTETMADGTRATFKRLYVWQEVTGFNESGTYRFNI